VARWERVPAAVARRCAPDTEDAPALRWRSSDCNRQLAAAASRQQVLTVLVDEAVRLFGAERGFLVAASGHESPGFAVAVARSLDREAVANPEPARCRRRSCSARLRGRVMVPVQRGCAGRRPRGGAAASPTCSLRSVLCVPLRVGAHGCSAASTWTTGSSAEASFSRARPAVARWRSRTRARSCCTCIELVAREPRAGRGSWRRTEPVAAGVGRGAGRSAGGARAAGVAPTNLRHAFAWPASARRPSLLRCAARARSGGRHRPAGAADRREWHGQGGGGARAARQPVGTAARGVRGRERGGDRRRSAGERTVWPPAAGRSPGPTATAWACCGRRAGGTLFLDEVTEMALGAAGQAAARAGGALQMRPGRRGPRVRLSTCAWWPRPTATRGRRWPRAGCARTSTSGWRW
jgi:hypothetical protein